MDYNLFGMNFIYLKKFKFRRLSAAKTDADEHSPAAASRQWNLASLDEYVLP
jgi:hypothetical protein